MQLIKKQGKILLAFHDDKCYKSGYRSKAKARQAIKSFGKRKYGCSRVYLCPSCDLWHLTKT